MRIIARSTLRYFWKTHPDAEQSLKTWKFPDDNVLKH
ncbi:hypothetical protein NIES4071_94940 [Calothrix sp. NIES-4071]|nr:hypothetical protein NIES4071_94940 [Calothrix sp. NIES-4071]BAZ63759.1 hypothetical protein NIES4105_94870 [Calothrix sp. NIES-4105]